MPYQFENRFTMTEEMLREYVQRTFCRVFLKICLLIFAGCCVVCLAAVLMGRYHLAAVPGVFGCVSLISAAALPFLSGRCFRGTQPQAYSHLSGEMIVRFGDRISLDEAGRITWFDYEQITKIKIYRSFFVLMMGHEDAVVLSPDGFSKGDSTMFWDALRQRRPALKIEAI